MATEETELERVEAERKPEGLELWQGAPRAISWSQLSKHWSCPEAYRISYRTEFPRQPSGAMLGGSAVHQAIEVAEGEGWWADEYWRGGSDSPIFALAAQAFAVSFGTMIAGGKWIEPDGWEWRPPWADVVCPLCGGKGAVLAEDAPATMVECEPTVRVEGEEALRWSGRLTIVEEEVTIRGVSTMQRLQKRGVRGLPLWSVPGTNLTYEAEEPESRPRGKGGKMLKDLAVWEKAREDLRWWVRNGPTMVRRAGALRRRDMAAGAELLAGAVERRVEVVTFLGGDEVRLVVVPDVALMHLGGELRIRDYKTGASGEPLQLAMYAWALGQLPEDHPLFFPAEIGEMVRLREDDSDYMVKEYDLRPWLPLVPGLIASHVAAVRREVEAEAFELRPSSWCASCDVRAACSYGQTLPERVE